MLHVSGALPEDIRAAVTDEILLASVNSGALPEDIRAAFTDEILLASVNICFNQL